MSVAELISRVATMMDIEEVKPGVRYVTIEGSIHTPREDNIKTLRDIFKSSGYTPFFEPNTGSTTAPHRIKVGLFTLKQVRQRPWLNWLLLAVTVITTTIAGTLMMMEVPEQVSGLQALVYGFFQIISSPAVLLKGLPYSLSIILILGSHELGHYITCRRLGVQATPPFFIPFAPPFGTMGAVIRMGLTPNRRALIRIGAAGPIAGFLVAIPVTFLGLMLSTYEPITPAIESSVQFGEPLVFQFLVWLANLIKGGPGPEYYLNVHPIALAGWLGFLVTSLNLLPLSQLDGGHISYGLFGKRRIVVTIITYVLLAGLVLWTVLRLRTMSVWLFWGILTLFLGLRHPPSEDEITHLKPGDIAIGVICLAMLAVTIIPVLVQ